MSGWPKSAMALRSSPPFHCDYGVNIRLGSFTVSCMRFDIHMRAQQGRGESDMSWFPAIATAGKLTRQADFYDGIAMRLTNPGKPAADACPAAGVDP